MHDVLNLIRKMHKNHICDKRDSYLVIDLTSFRASTFDNYCLDRYCLQYVLLQR